jgi:hypothetical protein
MFVMRLIKSLMPYRLSSWELLNSNHIDTKENQRNSPFCYIHLMYIHVLPVLCFYSYPVKICLLEINSHWSLFVFVCSICAMLFFFFLFDLYICVILHLFIIDRNNELCGAILSSFVFFLSCIEQRTENMKKSHGGRSILFGFFFGVISWNSKRTESLLVFFISCVWWGWIVSKALFLYKYTSSAHLSFSER